MLAGQGIATEKWDGTACLVAHGRLYRRMRVKAGKEAPRGWFHWSAADRLCEVAGEMEVVGAPGPESGHGWCPVLDVPADAYHREAVQFAGPELLPAGTYELVGPRIQGNPYWLPRHELWRHGVVQLEGAIGQPPTTEEGLFDHLRLFLELRPIEGIVWHHPDGRMAKIKRRDFGLPWPVKVKSAS